MKTILTAMMLMASFSPLLAQQSISLDEAIGKALRDYPSIRASRLQARSTEALSKSASALGELELSGGGEEIGHSNDAVYTLARVRQNIDPFGAAGMRRRLKAQASLAQVETTVIQRELARQVCTDYINDYAARLRYENMARMDSLYSDFSKVARLRYETQAISLLEYQTALNKSQQISLALTEARKDMNMAHLNLSRWLSADTLFTAEAPSESPVATTLLPQGEHPSSLLSQQAVNLSQAAVKEAKSQRLPKFFVEAGMQRIGTQNGFYAWQVGMSIPIAFGATSANVRAARLSVERAKADAETTMRSLNNKKATLQAEYAKYSESVDYYRTHALPLAHEQQRMAVVSYREGSIGYLDFIQSVNDALTTEMNYVEAYTKLLESKYNLLYY